MWSCARNALGTGLERMVVPQPPAAAPQDLLCLDIDTPFPAAPANDLSDHTAGGGGATVPVQGDLTSKRASHRVDEVPQAVPQPVLTPFPTEVWGLHGGVLSPPNLLLPPYSFSQALPPRNCRKS